MNCPHGLAFEVKCLMCYREAMDREAKINAAKKAVPKGVISILLETDSYKFRHYKPIILKSVDSE